jgi:hypothetical protein
MNKRTRTKKTQWNDRPSEPSSATVSGEQGVFDWPKEASPQRNSKIEPKSERTVGASTRHSDDTPGLGPMLAGPIRIGFVDEIVGGGGSEVPGFEITKNEILQLARYWSGKLIDLEFDYFATGCTGSTEWRTSEFARRRLSRIADFVGDEEVRNVFEEAEQNFAARIDQRAWRIFKTGTDEEREHYQEELYKNLFRDSNPPSCGIDQKANDECEIQDADSGTVSHVGTVITGPSVVTSFQAKDSLNEHVQDALAEFAFAKMYNLIWNGNPFRSCGPSGEDVYIQSVGASDPRQLVVNSRHQDSNIIVLAVVDHPRVSFLGWSSASDAKIRGRLAVNGQAENFYTVTAESLRPMEQLIR